jgi:hypothetical protein
MANNAGVKMPEDVKTWVIVVLTFVFIALYVGEFAGVVPAPKDLGAVARLEPIIFVIIGYYFGRLPSAQNEKNLKDQVKQKSDEADAVKKDRDDAVAQAAKAVQKLKDVDAALSPGSDEHKNATSQFLLGTTSEASGAAARSALGAVDAARRILKA